MLTGVSIVCATAGPTSSAPRLPGAYFLGLVGFVALFVA
jgi:hypothetical protein